MVKVNVGCGKRNWSSEGWISVDGADFPHVTNNDVSLKWMDNDSVDIIVASHLIAYFDHNDAVSILKEWLRVLKHGGVLHISTPNMYVISKLIADGMQLKYALGPVYGRAYGDGHKVGYDYLSMIILLGIAGFTNIEIYDHRTTCHPNTDNREDYYDDHSAAYIEGTLISLNVQATKP